MLSPRLCSSLIRSSSCSTQSFPSCGFSWNEEETRSSRHRAATFTFRPAIVFIHLTWNEMKKAPKNQQFQLEQIAKIFFYIRNFSVRYRFFLWRVKRTCCVCVYHIFLVDSISATNHTKNHLEDAFSHVNNRLNRCCNLFVYHFPCAENLIFYRVEDVLLTWKRHQIQVSHFYRRFTNAFF